MKIWILLACAALSAAAVSAAPPGRFSETLTDADRQACGLTILSSDQVASLNALVRRDKETSAAATPGVAARSFSQRLYPDEFESAGLNRLTAPQLIRLDGLVAASSPEAGFSAVLAAGPGAPPVAPLSASGGTPPEIHGLVALTYGFGGGTSFRDATTALSYVDPSHHFEIDAAYSDLEFKPSSSRSGRLP